MFKRMRKDERMKIGLYRIFLMSAVAVLLGACSLLNSNISYYDATTYKNLTDLKPRVVFLYDTFGGDSVDMQEVRSIRLTMAQMLEYERGKGEKNKLTVDQLKILRDMFEDDVQHRVKNGKWSPAQKQNQIDNISDAFDTAITTERLKNKNE